MLKDQLHGCSDYFKKIFLIYFSPIYYISLKLFSSDGITPYSKNFLLEHDALCLILSEKQVKSKKRLFLKMTFLF